MDRRAVRRWFGKPGRRWWHVYRLTLTLIDVWDEWLGFLALSGVDPRGWDLNRLLAAFEAQMRQSAKDESAWRRTEATLKAEPSAVRDQRRRELSAGRPATAGGMTVDDAEALLARFAASEAMYR